MADAGTKPKALPSLVSVICGCHGWGKKRSSPGKGGGVVRGGWNNDAWLNPRVRAPRGKKKKCVADCRPDVVMGKNERKKKRRGETSVKGKGVGGHTWDQNKKAAQDTPEGDYGSRRTKKRGSTNAGAEETLGHDRTTCAEKKAVRWTTTTKKNGAKNQVEKRRGAHYNRPPIKNQTTRTGSPKRKTRGGATKKGKREEAPKGHRRTICWLATGRSVKGA